jgi:DNA-binding NarL/FixJ family response regulator
MSIQNLTPREREIVASLCEGNSNKMIARELGINEGTVRWHLVNIFAKLGISNRTTLMALTIVHKDTFELRRPRAGPVRANQDSCGIAS